MTDILFKELKVTNGDNGLSILLNVTNLDGSPVDVPPIEVPPAVTPPPVTPPPLQLYTTHNLQCYGFSVKQTLVGIGAQLWFHFKVGNVGQIPVGYEILAPRTEEGQCARSWTRETMQVGQILEWDDHIEFANPGVYHLYMGVGFENLDELVAMKEPWFRLSDSITITVQ